MHLRFLLLLWFCCSEESDGSYCRHFLLCVWEKNDDNEPSSFSMVLLWWRRQRYQATVTFFYDGVIKKKKMIASVTFDGFVAKNGDGNFCCLFQWFCYKEGDGNNVVAFFYGGGVVKKAMATGNLLFLFLFSFWSFWSSSLEFTINNEMVIFFMLKVVMAKGRRLKKCGGDLEVHMQNVASSK